MTDLTTAIRSSFDAELTSTYIPLIKEEIKNLVKDSLDSKVKKIMSDTMKNNLAKFKASAAETLESKALLQVVLDKSAFYQDLQKNGEIVFNNLFQQDVNDITADNILEYLE